MLLCLFCFISIFLKVELGWPFALINVSTYVASTCIIGVCLVLTIKIVTFDAYAFSEIEMTSTTAASDRIAHLDLST